ncbi:hypothetical protein ANCDUO_15330 [Ancylostoma duodenale]|uniref:Dynein heavy chain coiled coil stalk domain-containing protein n=1 Tax=Ancylostoma duodenale TaxID=51022 RepID=A0A0C2G0T6_9BILA|nr:hypothetical protein ANCDUO_15330 [Ancylostoma duodenale]
MVEKRTQETLSEWERAKPVEGAQRPNEALAALNTFEQKMAKLSEDREKMRKARHALDMADPTGVPVDADKLAVAAEELADLKGVWQALTPIYTSVDEMKAGLDLLESDIVTRRFMKVIYVTGKDLAICTTSQIAPIAG